MTEVPLTLPPQDDDLAAAAALQKAEDIDTSSLSASGGVDDRAFSNLSLVSTDSSHPSHRAGSVNYLGDDESEEVAPAVGNSVFDDDDDYDDDELLEVKARRKIKRQSSSHRRPEVEVDEQCCSTAARANASSYEYLCIWKRCVPTWELRSDLEDRGCSRLCDAVDEQRKPDNQGKPHQAITPARVAGHVAAVSTPKLVLFPGQLLGLLGSLRIFLHMTVGALASFRVLRYAAVGSTKLERGFYQQWQTRDGKAHPELCYVVVDVCALHDMWANGIRTNAKKLQESFSAPHDQYLWCCSFPEAPLERAASGGPVVLLLCAALTGKPFLDSSWHAFDRKNGWFPMPADVTKLVPLVVFDVKPSAGLDGMDVLLSKEPRDMGSFTKLVEGLPIK
jgi:hypothetical protein